MLFSVREAPPRTHPPTCPDPTDRLNLDLTARPNLNLTDRLNVDLTDRHKPGSQSLDTIDRLNLDVNLSMASTRPHNLIAGHASFGSRSTTTHPPTHPRTHPSTGLDPDGLNLDINVSMAST